MVPAVTPAPITAATPAPAAIPGPNTAATTVAMSAPIAAAPPACPRGVRVAGLGFRRGAGLDDLRAALVLAEAASGRADALATAAPKAGHPALIALAAERGIPVLAVAVAGVATPTGSAASRAAHGTGSVAEAAALGARPGGHLLPPHRMPPHRMTSHRMPPRLMTSRLLTPRVIAPSRRATCAIALHPESDP